MTKSMLQTSLIRLVACERLALDARTPRLAALVYGQATLAVQVPDPLVVDLQAFGAQQGDCRESCVRGVQREPVAESMNLSP
jgi:hypothetical protein